MWHVKTLLKSEEEIGKLGPIGQRYQFLYELRMSFTFLSDWGVAGEEYFVTHGNYVNFKFQWRIALLEYSHFHCLLFMAMFCTTAAELKSCNGGHPSKSKIFTV